MQKREIFEVTVGDAQEGLRLDVFLSQVLPDFSRARLQALIEQGHVRKSDGQMIEKKIEKKMKVESGQNYVVEIPTAQPCELIPQPMDLTVLYEDLDILVLDKPAGLVVHPGPGHGQGTLVHGLLAHCKEGLSGIGGVMRPGIVHRLDQGTSGVMVVAKHDQAHQELSHQFASRTLQKIYWAFVKGRVIPAYGKIETLIGRCPKNPLKMAVVAVKGKEACTSYRFLKEIPGLFPISWLECGLHTGRTHQIRVHLKSLRYPLLGDSLYGIPYPGLYRPALHAHMLSFMHPCTKQVMTFSSPLPSDLQFLADE